MSEAHPSNLNVESDHEKFDQLIINHWHSGRPHMSFAFTMQFWFMDGWTHEKRAKLVEIAKDFYGLFPDDMSHFQKNSANRLSKITDNKFLIYYEQVNERIPSSEYFMVRIGDFKKEPANCEFMTLAVAENREARKPLSYVELRFPLSWVKQDIERLMRVLSNMSDKLKPVHAVGGVSPVFVEGLDDPKTYFPYLKRYTGLDYINDPTLTQALIKFSDQSSKLVNVDQFTAEIDSYVEDASVIFDEMMLQSQKKHDLDQPYEAINEFDRYKPD